MTHDSDAAEPARPEHPRGLEELRLSEARLRSIVNNSPLFIATVDRAGVIESLNRTVPGLVLSEALGKPVYDFIQPEHHDRARRSIELAFDTGESSSYESVAAGRFGSRAWYEAHVGPVRIDGRIVAVTLIINDITDRKRAEEALKRTYDELERRVEERTASLQAANEQLEAIYDRMVEGLVIVDNETKRFVRVNASFCRMLGYTEEELLAASIKDIHPPEEMSEDLERFEAASAGLVFSAEDRPVLRKDGSIFYADITGHRIVYEGRPCLLGLFRDVTERKRAQESLRQTHEELRAIYDGMPDGLLIADAETRRFVRANSSICEMLGYSESELLSMSVSDIHPAEDLPAVIEAFQAQVEGRLGVASNLPVLRRDGRIVYADITSNRILYNGRTCLMGFFRDVTERRNAEAALRTSEERFRSYFSQGLIGMAVTKLDKQWLEVNDRLCEILGYSREELLTMKWTDATHPDDLEWGVSKFNRLVAGEIDHVTHDKRFIHKSGAVVYVTVFVRCFRRADRTVDHFLTLIEDITERKRIADALQQSHDELRTIYDHIADGVIIADTEERHPIRANPAYCRMLGYSEQEAYSLSPERVHPPDVVSRVWEHLDEVKKGRIARIEDLPFLRKDGTVIYADVVSSPIHHNDRPCWICFFHDVTERKRDKESLAREHRTLKHLLQSSDHERQLIAYEIHDGLAQQLTGAIMQFETYAYQKDKQPRLAAEAFDAGMTMLRQGHFEARRLISGVRPPILDEAGIVAAIAHLVNEERHKKGPKIEYLSKVEFERLTPVLENAIYRIVQEGLNNACTHSKSKRVHVELVQQDDRVRIEVRDRGIGFKPDDIDDESHFGVAGIRERARLLGGSAQIESTPGKGTRIVVELPIVLRSDEDDEALEEERAEPSPGSSPEQDADWIL